MIKVMFTFNQFINPSIPAHSDVATLCENCPNLLELDLSDNSGITENCLESILNLENLQVLTLSRCDGIEPSAFRSFYSLQVLSIHFNE